MNHLRPRPRQWALEIYTAYLVLTGRRQQAYWYTVRFWLRYQRRKQHPLQCPYCPRRSRHGNPLLPAGQGILCEHCQQSNSEFIRQLTFTAEHRIHYSHEH